jgi:5-methylcytosine-specific restriction endonuclease McrA
MKAYFARADARRMETEGTARAVKIRSSSNWARVRAAYRSAFPLCCDPLNAHRGFPEPSEHVHHVIPLVERPDLAFDWENLRSVCASCHLRIEGMERKGSKTSHLFDGKREPHEVAKPT